VLKYGLSIAIAAHFVRMLLKGNTEVAFPSRITTIEAAVSLPTPSTDAAISNANVAAIAASVVSTLLTSAAGSFPVAAGTTAASAATPSTASASDTFASTVAATVAATSADQKRKARP
jgi:hypothetical protein